jgi:hypothetical protein
MPQLVTDGYARCPTCRALVRVLCKYHWGSLLAVHLHQGRVCPTTQIPA